MKIMSVVNHVSYMNRCLDLASRGIGRVAPNPPVGAVIVYEDRIIGEGWHKKFGDDHAEIMAINSIPKDDRKYVSQSTLYVSLEPCNHLGKTPPCTDRIIMEKIPRVVIGGLDPNPHVQGHGASQLSQAGVQVTSNICPEASNWMIRRFKSHIHSKPYFILKWAQSRDGFMGVSNQQVWISNHPAKILSHKWRSQIDGILIGNRTYLVDQPKLNNRLYGHKSPCRIILDMSEQITVNQLDKNSIERTIVLTHGMSRSIRNIQFEHVDPSVDFCAQLDAICIRHGLYTILVEGGQNTLQRFIDVNHWHEAWVIRAEKDLKFGISSPHIEWDLRGSYSLLDNEVDVLTRISD